MSTPGRDQGSDLYLAGMSAALSGRSPNVPDTGRHLVAVAEVALDRLGLGRRFDDHKGGGVLLGMVSFRFRPHDAGTNGHSTTPG